METLALDFSRQITTQLLIDDSESFAGLAQIPLTNKERIVLCFDQQWQKAHGDKLFATLTQWIKLPIVEIPLVASEQTKSFSSYAALIDTFEQHRCNLYDQVIVIGGGSIIDLVSFTVSTYMRGLPLIIMPTTLMGQIDVATAGKTCINSKQVKNLLGTFYYPSHVYNNIHLILTQEKADFRQGLSEALKYCLLYSTLTVELLVNYYRQPTNKQLAEIVRQVAMARYAISKRHPCASNLGHTFGHAIEKLSDFSILHGDAINIGTVMALCFAIEKNIIKFEVARKIITIMQSLELNLTIGDSYSSEQFVKLMQQDKKSSTEWVNLVLISDIAKPHSEGDNYFYAVAPNELQTFIESFLQHYSPGNIDYWSKA